MAARKQQGLVTADQSDGDRLAKQIRQFVAREADDRRELAGQVHEGPLQDLAVASIQLKLATGVGANSTVPPQLAPATSAVDRANRSLRIQMADLGPRLLTETGLDTALESIAVNARARWEIPLTYVREGTINPLPYVTQLLLLQSLWHLVQAISGWPGLIAGDLFVHQLASSLEIQVDFEVDGESSPDVIEVGWQSVDLHDLRDRLRFIGAEVALEVDGAMLRANYRVSC